MTQPDGRAATYSFDFRVIAASVGDDLEGKFLTFARYKVEETASMLLDACERLDVTLDSIELSGKTAYLPVVHATMAKLFPGVTIHRAPDPKECVVKGACLSQALQRGSVLHRLPDQGQRLTSSLGVFGPDSPFFIPLLNVDDPVPGDGLIATLPGFWDGRESVELWENLNPTGRLIEYSAAAQFLDRLGEWVPSQTARLIDGVRWTLQLTLRNFELTVEATGPEGDVIAFRPAHGNGD